MDREAGERFAPGRHDYNLTWLLLMFFGWLGLHRFYQGKILSGVVYLITGGLFGIGIVYDVLTLNEQLSNAHREGLGQYLPSWA